MHEATRFPRNDGCGARAVDSFVSRQVRHSRRAFRAAAEAVCSHIRGRAIAPSPDSTLDHRRRSGRDCCGARRADHALSLARYDSREKRVAKRLDSGGGTYRCGSAISAHVALRTASPHGDSWDEERMDNPGSRIFHRFTFLGFSRILDNSWLSK
jgi:hypothetical protein